MGIFWGKAVGFISGHFGHFLGKTMASILAIFGLFWVGLWVFWHFFFFGGGRARPLAAILATLGIFRKALGIVLFLKLVLGNASGLIGRVLNIFFFDDARLKFWQALRHSGRSLLRALRFARSGPKPPSARANPLFVLRVLCQGAAYLQCSGKYMTGRAAPQRWFYLSP